MEQNKMHSRCEGLVEASGTWAAVCPPGSQIHLNTILSYKNSVTCCTDGLYLGVWSVFSRWFWGHTWWCVFTSAPPDLDIPAHMHTHPVPAAFEAETTAAFVCDTGVFAQLVFISDHILWKQWGRRFSSSSSSSQSGRRYNPQNEKHDLHF